MEKETCEDCVHFDVRDHKMFCRHFDASMSSNYKGCCEYFKNKKQIVTTRNPYFSAQDLFSNFSKSANDAIDVMRYGWETIGNNYVNVRKEYNKMFNIDKVKKVIFNPPATIVYWFDGTKTVVKAQNGDGYDREKGFAMACAKKFFGNEGNYYNEFRKHDAIGGVEFKETDETLQYIPSKIAEELHSSLIEKLGKVVKSARSSGRYPSEANSRKSDYIIEQIKEFTRDFWMLKVYFELDTEEWVLDIGAMNNDEGKSMRYIVNLEDVEWERIDESIGRVTSSIANELIPFVWKKGE